MSAKKHNDFCALIPAAGKGERMQSKTRKTFLCIDSVPIILHTLSRVKAVKGCKKIAVAVHPEDVDFINEKYGRLLEKKLGVGKIIPGGKSRQESVLRLLETVKENHHDTVLIHDGARPLLRPRTAKKVVDFVVRHAAGAVAAVPAGVTIKKVEKNRKIASTPSRDSLWLAQTPQVFPADVIMAAYERAAELDWKATDDSALVEWTGKDVFVVQGDHDNLKVTNPQDLSLAETLFKYQKNEGIVPELPL